MVTRTVTEKRVTPAMDPVDARQFRNALGSFVTGVTIVTTLDHKGKPVGLTANSFNSVSLDPPMILWSLALNSGALAAFRGAEWWAVHILSARQEELSSRFARRGADRFEGLATGAGPGGIPLLGDCAARFICRTAFEYEGGDHAIFVGEVVEFDRQDVAPLIYHDGGYSQVLPKGEPAPALTEGNEGAFGRHFLGHLLGSAHHEMLKDVRHEYRRRGLRGAEYTVLVSLGLGEDCTRDTLVARAARAGVHLPMRPVDDLAARGLLKINGASVMLTEEGRRMLVELVAVAQASQLVVDGAMSAAEASMLRQLLERVVQSASQRPRQP